MIKALKIIFLFQNPDWDDFRAPYILAGIIGWAEIISIALGIYHHLNRIL